MVGIWNLQSLWWAAVDQDPRQTEVPGPGSHPGLSSADPASGATAPATEGKPDPGVACPFVKQSHRPHWTLRRDRMHVPTA